MYSPTRLLLLAACYKLALAKPIHIQRRVVASTVTTNLIFPAAPSPISPINTVFVERPVFDSSFSPVEAFPENGGSAVGPGVFAKRAEETPVANETEQESITDGSYLTENQPLSTSEADVVNEEDAAISSASLQESTPAQLTESSELATSGEPEAESTDLLVAEEATILTSESSSVEETALSAEALAETSSSVIEAISSSADIAAGSETGDSLSSGEIDVSTVPFDESPSTTLDESILASIVSESVTRGLESQSSIPIDLVDEQGEDIVTSLENEAVISEAEPISTIATTDNFVDASSIIEELASENTEVVSLLPTSETAIADAELPITSGSAATAVNISSTATDAVEEQDETASPLATLETVIEDAELPITSVSAAPVFNILSTAIDAVEQQNETAIEDAELPITSVSDAPVFDISSAVTGIADEGEETTIEPISETAIADAELPVTSVSAAPLFDITNIATGTVGGQDGTTSPLPTSEIIPSDVESIYLSTDTEAGIEESSTALFSVTGQDPNTAVINPNSTEVPLPPSPSTTPIGLESLSIETTTAFEPVLTDAAPVESTIADVQSSSIPSSSGEESINLTEISTVVTSIFTVKETDITFVLPNGQPLVTISGSLVEQTTLIPEKITAPVSEPSEVEEIIPENTVETFANDFSESIAETVADSAIETVAPSTVIVSAEPTASEEPSDGFEGDEDAEFDGNDNVSSTQEIPLVTSEPDPLEGIVIPPPQMSSKLLIPPVSADVSSAVDADAPIPYITEYPFPIPSFFAEEVIENDNGNGNGNDNVDFDSWSGSGFEGDSEEDQVEEDEETTTINVPVFSTVTVIATEDVNSAPTSTSRPGLGDDVNNGEGDQEQEGKDESEQAGDIEQDGKPSNEQPPAQPEVTEAPQEPAETVQNTQPAPTASPENGESGSDKPNENNNSGSDDGDKDSQEDNSGNVENEEDDDDESKDDKKKDDQETVNSDEPDENESNENNKDNKGGDKSKNDTDDDDDADAEGTEEDQMITSLKLLTGDDLFTITETQTVTETVGVPVPTTVYVTV